MQTQEYGRANTIHTHRSMKLKLPQFMQDLHEPWSKGIACGAMQSIADLQERYAPAFPLKCCRLGNHSRVILWWGRLHLGMILLIINSMRECGGPRKPWISGLGLPVKLQVHAGWAEGWGTRLRDCITELFIMLWSYKQTCERHTFQTEVHSSLLLAIMITIIICTSNTSANLREKKSWNHESIIMNLA